MVNESMGSIETYAILRVNIGDRPAACLGMLATRITAQLPEFEDHKAAVDTIICKSMYVDDIIDSSDSQEQVEALKTNVEHILARGWFKIKVWFTSGVKPPESKAAISLPNALKENESTALGLGYKVGEDFMYVRSSINFSKKIQKMRMGPDLSEDKIEANLPTPLTKRIVLSQLIGTFDPSVFVSPFKMKGSILFRKMWQCTLDKNGNFADWDAPISLNLAAQWLLYFKESTNVSNITFTRSLKVPGCRKPYLVTFSDGSDDAVVYIRWETDCGNIIRLVEAKGKLCPLHMKCDTVKSEMCGAVFASRLCSFVLANSRIRFTKVYHFVDSMTVLGAINKESYGFGTFYANRIGEILEAISPKNWFCVPSDSSPADLITRGTSPEQLHRTGFW